MISLAPLVSVAGIGGAAVLVWIAAVRVMPTEDDEEENDEERFFHDLAEDRPFGGADAGQYPQALQQPRAEEQPQAPPDAAAAPQPATNLSDRTTTQLPGGTPTTHAGSGSMADACGFIVIFTLREGAARPFDRLAESTAQLVREREPATLVYACHSVADAPQQRIFYELYRDRSAMQDHERQPHVRRFIAEREQYVLATNVVRLKLNTSTGLPEPTASY